MITKKEIQATQLSATKKDFYQIWNELLETAGKISERWDPSSTNESDPGIVLLKVLTAIADKLNYNIDKNILEAFMPSAAQEESMRKLCEMMGYNIKYYQSATTDVVIKFVGDWYNEQNEKKYPNGILIPRFTNIKNEDDDVNYVTLENFYITKKDPDEILSVPCIEGQLVQCETNINNIISLTHLDDNNRYYLPETQIAENGIFIRNLDNNVFSEEWKKVDNLNTQELKSKVYKFGFDSKARLPYVQFPEDISYLIEDGLYIDYIRTSGANGNISAKTLSKLTDFTGGDKEYYEFNADDWSVSNPSATKNGTNIETLNQAYNNYKKTVGTFDTLVTCRDYMNKIYQLTTDDANTTPLVSNINVTDVRNDINRSITLCTFNEHGINYKTIPQVDNGKEKITHFDLVLYPFKTIYNITKNEYKKSFTYDTNNYYEIISDLENYKTISHNICLPNPDELVCIKNYININAEIVTTRKINYAEELDILDKVKTALYAEFNMRNIDFGEEIPEEEIIKCIQEADTRIKYVYKTKAFDIYTKFVLANGTELDLLTDNIVKEKLDKLILQNVLAGRVSLFNQQNILGASFTEGRKDIYPDDKSKQLIGLMPKLKISEGASNLQLKDNEVIQFRLPNYKTTLTYPAYTNYFIKLNTDHYEEAVAASFKTLKEFLETDNYAIQAIKKDALRSTSLATISKDLDDATFKNILTKYGFLFKKTNDVYTKITVKPDVTTEAYYLVLNNDNLAAWNSFLQDSTNGLGHTGYCIYDRYSHNLNYPIGYLVDESHHKFRKATTIVTGTNSAINNYYIQNPNPAITGDTGLGKNLSTGNISLKDTEYQLTGNEILYVNYTPATKAEDGSTTTGTPVYKYYGKGTIIRANFDLVDSNTLRTTGKDWAKKNVIDLFSCANDDDHIAKYGETLPRLRKLKENEDDTESGMYSLSASEQIEIIEPVEVKLEKPCYISWTLNNPKIIPNTKTQTIPFNDVYDETTHKLVKTSYILQENEYVYYTNKNKEDIAIYGCGTEIIRSNTSLEPAINQDTKYSAEDIIEKGLGGVLDWAYCNFDKTNDYFTLKEYKYLNLTSGDIIVSANLTSASNANVDIITEDITDTWRPCYKATYIMDGTQQDIPTVKLYSDATFAENKRITWEVRSKLCLDFNSSKAQVIRKNTEALIEDFIELEYLGSSGHLFDKVEAEYPAQSDEAEQINTIKANYPCTSTLDYIDVSINEYDSDGNISKVINDFKLKAYEDTPVVTWNNITIPLGNFGNGLFTKLDFSQYKPATAESSRQKTTELKISVSDNEVGLISWYYVNGNADTNTYAYLKFKKRDGDYFEPVLYNSINSNNFIEYNEETNECRILNEKLATFKFTKGDYIIEIYPDASNTTSIFFSNLSLIQEINGSIINENLGLSNTNINSINNIITSLIGNNNFFYNCPITNSTAISLNTVVGHKMTDPHIWYDYNNICNNFVISEIDADYLEKGITISPTSKL